MKTLFTLLAALAVLVGVAGTTQAQYVVRPAAQVMVVRPVVRVVRPATYGTVGSHCGFAAPSCVRVIVGYDCHGRPIFGTRCR